MIVMMGVAMMGVTDPVVVTEVEEVAQNTETEVEREDGNDLCFPFPLPLVLL